MVWEDNQGALTLANMELPRMTPRSKHIEVKYHWFWSKVQVGKIEIQALDTNQVADIFTKELRVDTFFSLRKMLAGWWYMSRQWTVNPSEGVRRYFGMRIFGRMKGQICACFVQTAITFSQRKKQFCS